MAIKKYILEVEIEVDELFVNAPLAAAIGRAVDDFDGAKFYSFTPVADEGDPEEK